MRGKPVFILELAHICDLDALKLLLHSSGWMGFNGCFICDIVGEHKKEAKCMSWHGPIGSNYHVRQVLDLQKDLYIPLIQAPWMCRKDVLNDIMHGADMGFTPDLTKVPVKRGIKATEKAANPSTWCRMTKEQSAAVSEAISALVFTKDGGRKQRPLKDWRYFKAEEWMNFLHVYGLPVLLHNVDPLWYEAFRTFREISLLLRQTPCTHFVIQEVGRLSRLLDELLDKGDCITDNLVCFSPVTESHCNRQLLHVTFAHHC